MMSSKQIIHIMIIYILGSALVMGGNTTAKQDSWISILLAMLLMIPICFMYGKLSKLYPGKNIFDMFYESFGKIAGSVFTAIFTIYALHLGAIVTRNFTEFIETVSLPETPQFAVAIVIGVLSLWTVKAGIEILGRGAVLVTPIVGFTVILTLLANINHIDLSYIQPVFAQGLGKIFSGSIYYISFPFAEVVLFLSVMPCVDSKTNPYKIYLTSLAVGGFLLLLAMLRNILVLGMPTLQSLYFPSYTAVGVINIREFITRIEVLVAGNFIISGLAKACICLYVACKGMARLFNVRNYKVFAAPAAFLMIAVSGWLFSSTMEMMAFLEPYKYYAPVLQILVPFAILLIALVKKRKNKKTTAEKA